MSEVATPAVPFEINGNVITQTAVHLYATVRIRVALPPTQDAKQALADAMKEVDLERDFRRGEYADEITAVLVDQISGDYEKNSFEYEHSENLTPDGDIDHGSSVEQGKFIVVGTGNITQADSKILADLDQQAAPMMIAPTGDGWIVSLRPCREAEVERLTKDMAEIGFSSAFVTLWKGLRSRGYGLMQIDQDACPHPEFAVFEW